MGDKIQFPELTDPAFSLMRASKQTGFSRPHFYNLERAGVIQLTRLIIPGNKRGKTLIRKSQLEKLLAMGTKA
jgi:hypothetical protein